MTVVKTLDEFRRFRRDLTSEVADARPSLVICAGTGGQASGANGLLRVLKRRILEEKLEERLALRITGCLGLCEMDPFIIVEPGGNLYPKLTMDDVPAVMDAAVRGDVVEKLLYRESGTDRPFPRQDDIPFFKHQNRRVLGVNQRIDPIRILDYIRAGGYAALERVFARPDPAWVIAEVTASGLRGRGGAGFPTGKKWAMARQAGRPGVQKYIICNGDEGDPGAYMDRSVLEGNPHAVIEGMIVAAVAIGATRGIVYVRSEYPLAVKHVLIAIRQAREFGALGADILGTGIDFDVDIVRGAGAFVCGEETALIRSIEGYVGEPRQRPPYPIEEGLYGCPTCINNVETLANIPLVIRDGGEAFAKIGVPGNTGTKIFSLVGKVRNTGLVEVPLGTSLRDIVFAIGGGPPGKAPIKAVQTGGPSGGCIPARLLDIPVDYESLAKAGSIMGSGGMIVMDESTCMVDIAKYFMKFLKEESCGKCFSCRKGTQRMHEILEDIAEGRATGESLGLLEELAVVVKDASLCGLGQTSANPILSALRYFRDEFVEHVVDRRCRAGVCKALISYSIGETCRGCGACLRACPAKAIHGEKKERHVIDATACIKCGVCRATCKFDAIEVR
ncbi:MAG: NADH-quinone oxidoreductase subunit NuoF [Planctomycetota bacterium]